MHCPNCDLEVATETSIVMDAEEAERVAHYFERNPLVVVMMGKPGTGKTTLAKKFADEHDCERVSTDDIRLGAFDDPAYNPIETLRVYESVIMLAKAALFKDGCVVLDGTFGVHTFRNRVHEQFSTDVEIQWYRVTCNSSMAKARLISRDDDVGPSVHDKVPFEEPDFEYTTVDTTGGK